MTVFVYLKNFPLVLVTQTVTWGDSAEKMKWCSFSHSDTWFINFLFLPDSATVFPPSHPLVSYCLKFLESSVSMFGQFSPVVDSSCSVINVMLIEMLIKCCYIVVWQTNGIQCVITKFCRVVPLGVLSVNLKWLALESL